MLTFITTPTDLIGQISPVATGLIGDFAPYAALIIGIAIGLWIVGWVIEKIGDVRQHSEIAHHLSRLTPAERAEAYTKLNIAERGAEEEAFVSESLEDYKSHF